MNELIEILIQNLGKLDNWILENKIDAYRIYDRELTKFPSAIDIYLKKAHIQIYESESIENEDLLISEIEFALEKVLSIPKKDQYIKSRRRQKEGAQYEKVASAKERFIIRENDAKFYVNLKDYLDTGIFLDHRKTRNLVKNEFAKKKERMLNLFSYTSSFSVVAAKAGVRYTTSVDMSNTYCDWSRDNFELNGLEKFNHIAIRENVQFFLENMKQSWRFDLIVIDPPTFSRSKKMPVPFDVQKDHPFLINHCLDHLNQDGIILFSNNFQKFKLNADALNTSNVRDITKETIPEDFRNDKIHKCYLIGH
ncbi:MAG: class I SAM-dependent methyltransferase [Leptospiraceae bacterium]|nr:class I SAM-dependent methyltransferase [Leptospiraceae bacterium]